MNKLFYLLLSLSVFQVPICHSMEFEREFGKKEEEQVYEDPFSQFADYTKQLVDLLKKNASFEDLGNLVEIEYEKRPTIVIETGFGPIEANALMAVILFNRMDVFEKFLPRLRPADIDIKNNKGQTALMLATAIGNKNMVEQLLSRGASIGISDIEHKSVTQYTDDQTLVRLLESYENPLMKAVQSNDIETIKKLISINPYLINQIDASGKTPFDYAIDKDPNNLAVPMLWNAKNPRSLELALIKMIDANNLFIIDRLLRIANEHYPQLYFLPLSQVSTTALIYAIKKKKAVVASHIIEDFLRQLAIEYKKLTAKYKPEHIKPIIRGKLREFLNYKDTVGVTALMYAIKQKELPLIQLLLGSNAVYLKPQDNTGATALTYAVKTGDPVILDTIFKSPIFKKQSSAILRQDQEGKLPLMYAIELQYPQIITMLLDIYQKKNFGFGLMDSNGKTPLLYAILYDNAAVVRALLNKQPALVNIADKQGKTPLMYAIEKDNPQLVIPILGAFPSLDMKDIRGFTALDYVHGMLETTYPHAREIAGLIGDYERLAEQKPEIPGRPVKQRRRE